MNTYCVKGTAFDGDPFDYLVDSGKSMLDFVNDELDELAGAARPQVKTFWVDSKEVIIYGMDRLYLITQIKVENKS